MSTVYTICMQGKALDIAEICAPWDSPLSEDLLDGWTDLDFTMAMTSVRVSEGECVFEET